MNYQGKSFKDFKELVEYLVTNKKEILELKKHSFKKSNPTAFNSFGQKTVKALNSHFSDDPTSGNIKRTIVLNTYNWFDSHYDVHLNGVFSKSISERKEKIWHLHDHEHKISAKVGIPFDIYEKSIDWADLGVNALGSTSALFMDSEIKEKYNPMIFDQYLHNKVDQHSVGMYYVKMELGINDSEQKEEFATWNKYFDLIGNKEEAEKVGFAWFIKEAKLIEGSAVLQGSNELTPTAINEPSIDTHNKEKETKEAVDSHSDTLDKSISDKLDYLKRTL